METIKAQVWKNKFNRSPVSAKDHWKKCFYPLRTNFSLGFEKYLNMKRFCDLVATRKVSLLSFKYG